MTRALTRTNFNSSKLIRILADLAILESVAPRNAFAEELSLWIGFTDAINLCAVHNVGAAKPPDTQFGVQSIANAALGEEFTRTRAHLTNSIAQSCSPNAGRTRITLASPKPGTSVEDAVAYEPYRRFHLAHQRDMDASVRPLRAKARAALARTSPALMQLAALDEALDDILCERENKLLSTVPSLLAKRFERMRKEHQQKLAEAQQADNPDLWMKPGGWLTRFCNELQAVLLAELDVRLQPTVGLIEALNNDKTKHP